MAAAITAPAIAPAIVTARSSQYIARTYNALAAPAVAPIAKIVAPVAPVASVAVQAPATLFAPSAPILARASPLVAAPNPVLSYAAPTYTAAYTTAYIASSPLLASARITAPVPSIYAQYLSGPVYSAANIQVAAPLAATPLTAIPPITRTFPATTTPQVVNVGVRAQPQNNQPSQDNNDDSISISAESRIAAQQPNPFRNIPSASALAGTANRSSAPQDPGQFERNQAQPNQGNNGLDIARAISIAQAGNFPQFGNIPLGSKIPQRENIPQERRAETPSPRNQLPSASIAPRENIPSPPPQASPYYSNAVAVSNYLPAKP